MDFFMASTVHQLQQSCVSLNRKVIHFDLSIQYFKLPIANLVSLLKLFPSIESVKVAYKFFYTQKCLNFLNLAGRNNKKIAKTFSTQLTESRLSLRTTRKDTITERGSEVTNDKIIHCTVRKRITKYRTEKAAFM